MKKLLTYGALNILCSAVEVLLSERACSLWFCWQGCRGRVCEEWLSWCVNAGLVWNCGGCERGNWGHFDVMEYHLLLPLAPSRMNDSTGKNDLAALVSSSWSQRWWRHNVLFSLTQKTTQAWFWPGAGVPNLIMGMATHKFYWTARCWLYHHKAITMSDWKLRSPAMHGYVQYSCH